MHPGHQLARVDLQTATKSMQTFDKLLDLAQTVAYEAINRVIKDLYKKAVSLVGVEHIEELDELDAWGSSAGLEGGMSLYGNEADFTEFGHREHQPGSDLEFESLLNPFVMEELIPN